jgi:hypothetical protein
VDDQVLMNAINDALRSNRAAPAGAARTNGVA